MRKEKDRTRYSTSLSEKNIEKIDKLSLETGLKKTRIIDKALKMAFSLYESDKLAFYSVCTSDNSGRKGYSTSLDKDDIKEIDNIAYDTGLNKNQILDKALFLIFKIYDEDKIRFFDI